MNRKLPSKWLRNISLVEIEFCHQLFINVHVIYYKHWTFIVFGNIMVALCFTTPSLDGINYKTTEHDINRSSWYFCGICCKTGSNHDIALFNFTQK